MELGERGEEGREEGKGGLNSQCRYLKTGRFWTDRRTPRKMDLAPRVMRKLGVCAPVLTREKMGVICVTC